MKKNVFEGKLYEWMRILSQMVALNFIWLFTTIPIITIGVSTAALYDTTVMVVLPDKDHYVKYYFKSYVRHLKNCVMPGIIFLFYLGLMVLDCYQSLNDKGYYLLPLQAWLVIAVFLMCFFFYLFYTLAMENRGFVDSLSDVCATMFRQRKTTIGFIAISGAAIVVGFLYWPIVPLMPGILCMITLRLLPKCQDEQTTS